MNPESALDEISRLNNELVNMHRDLAKRNQELRQSNEGLEKAVAEKAILLRELSHRVKNSLASVGAVLALEAKGTADIQAAAILRAAEARVRVISSLYELLVVSQELSSVYLGPYLERIGGLIKSLGNGTVELDFRLGSEPIRLSTYLATTIGYCCNELVTNSLKYAFPDGRPGRIEVRAQDVDGELRILFRDNGVGFQENSVAEGGSGFGLFLVRGLASQHGGRVRIDSSSGTLVELTFPAYQDQT